MNIDDLPIFLGLFWYGFSLTYVILVWFWRVWPQWDRKAPDEQKSYLSPVPYIFRLVISVLGIAGALGGAALVATFRHRVPGVDACFLAGLFVGIMLAYRLHLRKPARGQAAL
ncbi:MAG: hypothetical protein KJZ92_10880 [Rhodocyclaceae bacterium]|jgi:hypothetical protein|nr:hypothetical protein [Rhodocyclaceae bacterium]